MCKLGPGILIVLLSVSLSFANDGRLEISQQLIPYTITNAGSYVLTENLTATSGVTAITVATNDVTLDLNGFAIQGTAGSLHGVDVSGSMMNIVVANGFIRGLGQQGINAASASNVVVRGLEIARNGGDGARVGQGFLIVRSSFYDNGQDGLSASAGVGTIDECNVRANGRYGINAGDHTLVSDSTCRENANTGVRVGLGSAVIRTALRDNRGNGIETGLGSLVSDVSVIGSGTNGVQVASGCRVQRVQAFSSSGFGIAAGPYASIEDCTMRINTNGGLRVTNVCLVVRSIASQNGVGPGIRVQGFGSRVEGNEVNKNAIGIEVTGTNNLVVKNFAHDNSTTNFSIVAGNRYEIVTNPGTNTNAFQEAWASFSIF